MKQWKGLWFPENEEHLIEWMQKVNVLVDGKPTYQYSKYKAARDLCKQRRVVVDIGGNLGLWSRVMCLDFSHVEAFEPVPTYGDCFERNAPNAKLNRVALGETMGVVSMAGTTPNSVGDTSPSTGATDEFIVAKDILMHTLDSYELEKVDLIKIDCEGYELPILKGGQQTLLRNKPVVIVEQKPTHGTRHGYEDDAAVKYLQGLGMSIKQVVSGDYIMVW